MRGNNQETASAFFAFAKAGKNESGESYTGNLSFENRQLFSYRMCIATRLPTNPPMYLLRAREESPSVTTSQHMSNAFRAAHSEVGFDAMRRVHFGVLERAGLDLSDIQSIDDTLGGSSYVVCTEKGYLTYLHATDFGNAIRTPKDLPFVTWTRDKPQSLTHLIWSMLPKKWWSAALEGRVYRVGELFFVLEPDVTGNGREEQYVNVARVGYDRTRVGVLRRHEDHPELCTGQVRIENASFMPDMDIAKWYRIVASKFSCTYETKDVAKTPAKTELLEWPILPHSPDLES